MLLLIDPIFPVIMRKVPHPFVLTWFNARANNSRVKTRWGGIAFLFLPICLSVWSARPPEAAACPQLPDLSPPLTPAEIELYEQAQTLIGWTPSQVRDCPYLRRLTPSESQDQLPRILERVGQVGTLLFQEFPRISCDEVVHSEVFQGVRYSATMQEFQYIVIPRPLGDVLAYREYRTDPKGKKLDYLTHSGLFMTTSDFASAWLYLSPGDQRVGRFRLFGTQEIRNRECVVVGFAQDPDRVCRGGGFIRGGERIALLVQGLAWIDPDTFHILRITTWLLAPRMDVGLKSQTCTVDFYPVTPARSGTVLWLPRDVEVHTVCRGFAVHNQHHYSNFKLFRVESTIKPGR